MKKEEYLKMFNFEETHFWFIGKRLFIKAIFDQYIKKRRLKILDVGCGTGGLTRYLKNWGKVIGLEKNKLAIKLAKKRKIKVIQGEAEKLPFKIKSFNLITIFDVLYHKNIKNPEKVIQEAKRVLEPRGFLLITDSAFTFLKSGHDESLSGKRRFVIKQFEKILKKDGFKIIKSSYIFFSLFPFIFLKRKILNKLFKNTGSDVEKIPSFLNKLLIKLLFLEAYLLKKISFPIGSSLIILGQKME